MIYGQCRTNLDKYKRETWPHEFVQVPLVGERVEAESSKNSLKVCCITHKTFKRYKGNEEFFVAGILIELNR